MNRKGDHRVHRPSTGPRGFERPASGTSTTEVGRSGLREARSLSGSIQPRWGRHVPDDWPQCSHAVRLDLQTVENMAGGRPHEEVRKIYTRVKLGLKGLLADLTADKHCTARAAAVGRPRRRREGGTGPARRPVL